MKFSSISIVRSSASALIVAGTVFLGASGIACAQGGGYDKENPADYTDKKDPIKGHTGEPYPEKSSSEKGKEGAAKRNPKDKYYGMPKEKEEMDTGYVDQKKRSERATDARSPSPDPHVSDFPRDKKGRPMKDLKDEQGGPIGPN
jgi:hypothetical protein